MSPKLSTVEAALISSILEETQLKLSVFQNQLEQKFNGIKTFCIETQRSKEVTRWIRRIFQATNQELVYHRYNTLAKIVKEKAHKDKCDQLEDTDMKVEESKLEISDDEESLGYNMDMCVCNTVAAYENLATRYVKTKNDAAINIILNRKKIDMEKLEIVNQLKSIRTAREVEEKIWAIQKDFLEGQKEERTKDTEAWYKRFYEEKDKLYGSLVKLRQEIETLRDSYVVVEDDLVKKKELLDEHNEKAKAREVRTESEVPFRMVESWWRGVMVRLKLGKYEDKFQVMKMKIQKRKDEDIKRAKEIKNKYKKK